MELVLRFVFFFLKSSFLSSVAEKCTSSVILRPSVPLIGFVRHLPGCLHLSLICPLVYLSLVFSPLPCWFVLVISCFHLFLIQLSPANHLWPPHVTKLYKHAVRLQVSQVSWWSSLILLLRSVLLGIVLRHTCTWLLFTLVIPVEAVSACRFFLNKCWHRVV